MNRLHRTSGADPPRSWAAVDCEQENPDSAFHGPALFDLLSDGQVGSSERQR